MVDSQSRNETIKPGAAAAFVRSLDARAWHFWCAVSLLGAVALLLLALGTVPAQLLLSLAAMAAPCVIGVLGPRFKRGGLMLLALWGAAAVVSVCASGGLGGPLAALCLAPVLAAVVLDQSLWTGAALAAACVVASAAAPYFVAVGPMPDEPLRTGLSVAVLLGVAGATAGAVMTAWPRAVVLRQTKAATVSAFSALAEEAGALVFTMDKDGRSETVLGRPLSALPPAALQAGIISAAVPEEQGDVQNAIEVARRDGSSEVTFTPTRALSSRLRLSLRRAEGGILTGLVRPPLPEQTIVSTTLLEGGDLAERLAQSQAALADAEAGRSRAEESSAARARFLANMSHELRTPLNAIMGFSDMMRARMFGELAPKYGEYVELIHESGGHLLDLINDVLDVSKLEAQRYKLVEETFDARDPVNAALRLMRLQADDAGVKLRATLPKEPLMVHADRRAIKQIALNLLSNALKFTPKDGFVVLTLRAGAADLELIVADTGVGIAEEDLERLGRPFEQAGDPTDQVRGTGLGLSLVSAFAALHNGRMTLESRLGEGTAATVRLPVLAFEGSPGLAPSPRPTVAPADPPVMDRPPFGDAFEGLPKGVESDFQGTPASLLALVREEEAQGGYRSLSLDLGSRA